jgi:hypothetical protein
VSLLALLFILERSVEMANDLRIRIVGQLDKQLTKDDINKKIAELQGKVDKLKLEITMDDKIIKTLNDFATQMKKVGSVAQNSANNTNQSLKQQVKSVQELTDGYKELNKQIKLNRDGSVKSTTTTYADKKGNGRVITTNAKNEVVNYKDIESIAKFQKEQEKLRKSFIDLYNTGRYTKEELRDIGKGINFSSTIAQLNALKSRMSNMKMGTSLVADQEKLTKALKRSYDQSLMTEQRFQRFNNMINSAKNVAEIEKIQKALNRVNETSKNKNLQQSLLSQSNELLNSGSKKLNTTGIQSLITQLQALNPNAQNATRQLNQLQAQLKSYQN